MQKLRTTEGETRNEIAGRQVRAELPYLRRFGRALTGNPRSADRSVLQLMDDVIVDSTFLNSSSNPRIALFRRLLSILDIASVDLLGRDLAAIPTPRSRQAFLLTAIEGFSVEAAAEVLSVSESGFMGLLRSATKEVSQQAGANVLIIEDEVFIAFDLTNIIGDLGHIVTGSATTHREAIAEFSRTQPDLILSDVQLADGSSGIEAVDEIMTSANIPVIFITAFPERLLTGKKGEPTFVIAKPFNMVAVKATISQALFLNNLQK